MSENNFTLKELHLIRDSLKLGDLHTKLNDMINNYCDHDFEQTHIEMEMEYCNKCGIQAI